MPHLILEPLLAGLATGLFCCASCYPFLLPVFAAEHRGARGVLGVWLQVLGGRLAGYLLFGALAGWLGERLGTAGFQRASAVALMAMALILLLYAVGLLRSGHAACAAAGRGRSAPALLGFLMGVNVCPPFLLSLAYVVTLHDTLKGVVYFLVFFLATSIYLLPLLFAGLLGRMKEFRLAARLAAVAVGILFFVYGMLKL